MDPYVELPGEPGGSVSSGDAGPPARWATILTPVSADAIVSVLRSKPQWDVTPLKSGFLLHLKTTRPELVAEGDVVSTETGSRIQLAFYPRQRSAAIVGVSAGLTALLSVPAILGWVQSGVWGISVVAPIAAAVATLVLAARRSGRLSDSEYASVAQDVARALRGSEVS